MFWRRRINSVKDRDFFNSVSGEGDKIDKIFPIMAQEENKDWQVIALLSDDSGIPKNAADRLRVFDKIMAKAKEYGISPSRIHIDPLVEMLCTSENGIETNIEVISTVREKYPSIHITAAISNISFNLPVRKLINLGFVVLAMNAGLDSGILDPTNRDMLGLIYATEALLGEDDYWYGIYRGIQRRTDRTCKNKNGLKASLADCGVCQRRLKEHTKIQSGTKTDCIWKKINECKLISGGKIL